MTETIGFIGLGVLGSAVAENLVKAGLGVIAHDIYADKLTAFERQGGQAAASPNDVADRFERGGPVPGDGQGAA